MDDDELEQVMRAGLARRADEAAVDVGVLGVARDDARRRRRFRAVALGAAAVSAVAASVGVAVVVSTGSSGSSGSTAVDAARQDSSVAAPDAPAWRTEAWGDVQVDVPGDWGYGGGPDENGVACYPAAGLDATGEPVRARSTPPGYVGRPVALTDVCLSIDAGAPVTSPYVWLGAGLRAGTVDLGDGYVQETVDVAGSTVTVASDDDSLRRRILDSVGESERCLSELDRSGPLAHDGADDPDAEPATLRVCSYRLTDPGGRGGWELTSATDLGKASLGDYLAAVAEGDPPEDQCPAIDYQLTEAVVLELLDDAGGVLRQDAVNTFCPGIAVGADSIWPLETTRLTAEMARPWAVGAVGAVMHGDPDLGFIGPQG